jgi:hypothetical protein
MLEAHFDCPRDKAGILHSAAAFITKLQAEAHGDPRHQQSASVSAYALPSPAPLSTSIATTRAAWPAGIDYRQVFLHSNLPQVISSVDGRFLEVGHSHTPLHECFQYRHCVVCAVLRFILEGDRV